MVFQSHVLGLMLVYVGIWKLHLISNYVPTKNICTCNQVPVLNFVTNNNKFHTKDYTPHCNPYMGKYQTGPGGMENPSLFCLRLNKKHPL